jgi:hypothetical protein
VRRREGAAVMTTKTVLDFYRAEADSPPAELFDSLYQE